MTAVCVGLSFFTFPRPSKIRTEVEHMVKVRSFSIACVAKKHHWSNPLDGNLFPVKCLKDYEDRVEKIKKLLDDGEEEDSMERLMFVDAIQRLGVAHHFQKEIQTILNHHYTNNGERIRRCYSLHDVALSFRLFRQWGFHVSADAFNKFKGKDGRFKGEIGEDGGGLLELYEATQLSFEGEDILDEAEEFSNRLLSNSSINTTLTHPYHKTITRMTQNNHFQTHLENTKRWGPTLIKLANMDFALRQSLHQQELQNVSM